MRPETLHHGARRIAESLHRGLIGHRLCRIDRDSVRCAVAGYLIGADDAGTVQEIEDLETLTLRQIAETCTVHIGDLGP